MITPLAVTRANVWPVSCPDNGLDGVGPFERAPDPRPPPLEGLAVANSTKRSPATKVSRPIETRKLKNPPSRAGRQAGTACRLDFFFICYISYRAETLF